MDNTVRCNASTTNHDATTLLHELVGKRIKQIISQKVACRNDYSLTDFIYMASSKERIDLMILVIEHAVYTQWTQLTQYRTTAQCFKMINHRCDLHETMPGQLGQQDTPLMTKNALRRFKTDKPSASFLGVSLVLKSPSLRDHGVVS